MARPQTTTHRRFDRRQMLALGGATAMAAYGVGARAAAAQDDTSGSVWPREGFLPDYRILLYYGFPGNPNMGILGEHEPERVLELLEAEAENYRQADPSRPVKVGFELIASVAQEYPGADGLHIGDTPGTTLDRYTEFTRDNDMLLFFDVQMGYRSPKEDYEGLAPWLAEPHTHLAIDPEFRMYPDQLPPGQQIGQVTGEEVVEAQQWLADISSQEHDIPRKVLVIHQFVHSMIQNKNVIEPMIGVDLVIHMDGWGPPWMKLDTYTEVITNQPIEYNGFKIFYPLDDPVMSAEEVLALNPPPDLISFQ